IRPGFAVRRIMQLEYEVRAGFDQLCGSRRIYFGLLSGRKTAELDANSLAALLRLPPILSRPGLCRLLDEYDYVMDETPVAGPYLRGLYPFVFPKISGHRDIHIRHDAVRRNLDFLGHFDNRVGFADRPAIDKFRSGGQISSVALGSPLVDPLSNGIDFLL